MLVSPSAAFLLTRDGLGNTVLLTMRRLAVSLVVLALAMPGCAGYSFQRATTVQAQQGKAYIVQGPSGLAALLGFGGSTLWNCDATAGDPVCYKVVEIPAGAK